MEQYRRRITGLKLNDFNKLYEEILNMGLSPLKIIDKTGLNIEIDNPTEEKNQMNLAILLSRACKNEILTEKLDILGMDADSITEIIEDENDWCFSEDIIADLYLSCYSALISDFNMNIPSICSMLYEVDGKKVDTLIAKLYRQKTKKMAGVH